MVQNMYNHAWYNVMYIMQYIVYNLRIISRWHTDMEMGTTRFL